MRLLPAAEVQAHASPSDSRPRTPRTASSSRSSIDRLGGASFKLSRDGQRSHGVVDSESDDKDAKYDGGNTGEQQHVRVGVLPPILADVATIGFKQDEKAANLFLSTTHDRMPRLHSVVRCGCPRRLLRSCPLSRGPPRSRSASRRHWGPTPTKARPWSSRGRVRSLRTRVVLGYHERTGKYHDDERASREHDDGVESHNLVLGATFPPAATGQTCDGRWTVGTRVAGSGAQREATATRGRSRPARERRAAWFVSPGGIRVVPRLRSLKTRSELAPHRDEEDE